MNTLFWLLFLSSPALWSSQKEHLDFTINTELSRTSADKDQRTGAHYTGFKLAALAPCAFQD